MVQNRSAAWLSRRSLLRGSAGVFVAAAGASLISSCGSGNKPGSSGDSNSSVKLPSYQKFNTVKPDLPGDPNTGVQDGYLKEPARPVQGIKSPPGKGGSVTALVVTYSPVPPPVGKNRYWQALNKRLGTNLNIFISPSSDFSQKVQTTIAGDDLPDFMQIMQPMPQLPALLSAKFQDLSKYLSGDAVHQYPYLANIPADYWKPCIFNGGIYGVPIPRGKMGGVLLRRDDLINAKGLNPDPASFAEFETLCKDLTELRSNIWALSDAPLGFVEQMLGVCNGWLNNGGKLTYYIEQPETKQALSAVAKLVKAGYVHPDSFGNANSTTSKQWFFSGSAILHSDNFTGWAGAYKNTPAGQSPDVGGMLPPNYDTGTTATHWQGSPDFSFTALKKASDSRIRELLGIANYLAAPFGTAEQEFIANGVPGVDYTMKGGQPKATNLGKIETGLSLGYIATGPAVLKGPYTKATTDLYNFEKKYLPGAIADPTQDLYSETAATKSANLSQQLTDAQNAILQGRQPVSSWDDAVRTWRDGGGDQIRHEYEEQLQNQPG